MGTLYKGGRPSMKMLIERAKKEKGGRNYTAPDKEVEIEIVHLENTQEQHERNWNEISVTAQEVWDIAHGNYN